MKRPKGALPRRQIRKAAYIKLSNFLRKSSAQGDLYDYAELPQCEEGLVQQKEIVFIHLKRRVVINALIVCRDHFLAKEHEAYLEVMREQVALPRAAEGDMEPAIWLERDNLFGALLTVIVNRETICDADASMAIRFYRAAGEPLTDCRYLVYRPEGNQPPLAQAFQ